MKRAARVSARRPARQTVASITGAPRWPCRPALMRWSHARNETGLQRERWPLHIVQRSRATPPVADFVVYGGGSVYLVRPLTNAARDHLSCVVGAEAQFLGDAVGVEHRYIAQFVAALTDDGFSFGVED
jgi:hypothetical protein